MGQPSPGAPGWSWSRQVCVPQRRAGRDASRHNRDDKPEGPRETSNRAHLVGKRLNFSHELPRNEILRESHFKKIVSGESTDARRLYRDPFEFVPEAAHLFAANELPPAPGATNAFWDRWAVVGFNRLFRGTGEEVKDLSSQIAAELPGVVAWMIEGARRLLHQGTYTIPPSSYRLLREWRLEGDGVAVFLEEQTVPIAATVPAVKWPLTKDLYMAYKQFCVKAGFRNPVNLPNFTRRAKQLGTEYRHSDGGRLRVRLNYNNPFLTFDP